MKKLLYILFLIPVLAFGQSTLNQNQVPWNSAPPIKVNPGTIFNTFGDSFTNNNGGTVPGNGYAPQLATFLGLTQTNYAVSGSGMWNVAKQELANENTGHTAFSLVMGGFNDLRRGGSSSLTLAKILNGYSSIFVNHFADTLTAAGTSTARIVETGTWSNNYNAASVGGKTTSAASTSANGATITNYSYGPDVEIGFIGTDGTLYTYGTATLTIDGVSYGTIDENHQTDGITDGQGNDNGRTAFVKIYTGLGEGRHTVVLTTTSTNQFVVDYFAQLRKQNNSTPLLLYQIPRMNATGYTISPANSSDAIVAATNASLVTTVAAWPSGFPVFLVNTNNYYTAASGQVNADNIHPNDYGHRLLYYGGYTLLYAMQRNNFLPQAISTTASPTFVGLTLTGATTKGIVYSNAGALTVNASDFNYDFSTNKLGLGVSGVNTDSKFRVLGTTGAGIRIEYNGTNVNYFDGNTQHFRTSAGGGEMDLTSSAGTFYGNVLPSSNGTLNLGGSSQVWNLLYANNAIVGGSQTIAAWGTAGPSINAGGFTYTDNSTAAGATVTNAFINTYGTPTITAANATSGSKVTYTNAATNYISAGPSLGTNTLGTNGAALYIGGASSGFTNNYAILSNAGTNLFNGAVYATGTISTTSTTTSANFFANTTNALGSSQSASQLLFGGASNVQFRASFSGNSSTTASANTGISNVIVGSAPVTMASSGTVPIVANLAITAPGTITNGSSITITRSAALEVDGAGSGATTNDAVYVKNGNVELGTSGQRLLITEGSNGIVGQTTLVAGTKAITITGLTTSSRAIITLVSQGGTVTTTVAYAGVCTANTLTITALTNAGSTDTTDTSVLNYFVLN